jgi:hypothetical protein
MIALWEGGKRGRYGCVRSEGRAGGRRKERGVREWGGEEEEEWWRSEGKVGG